MSGIVKKLPRGRPPGFKGLAASIRRQTDDGEELIEFALSVFRNPAFKLSDRWAALAWLADRGYGRAPILVEATIDNGGIGAAFDLGALATGELDDLENLLSKAAGVIDVLPEAPDSE